MQLSPGGTTPRTPRGASDGAKISDAQRVLVVDDDADVRDSLRRALGYAGYEVATAVNGAEALKSVAKSPVDLIILDVLMPMLDGLGACRALRDRGDGTPVLVLTARDAVDDRVAGLDAGADDYLVKPFALRELVARMTRCCGARSRPATCSATPT
jgi:two-component system response regulator MprA